VFASEAARLREILLAAGEVSPLLNLGSSTGHFRAVEKPHIEAELFAPLREAGIEVVHCDLKPASGVDIAGDILDLGMQQRLVSKRFRCVLLSNLLEHVADRAAVAAACEQIAGEGGLVLATVPSSFPFHADPIDSGYRPAPDELAALFAGSSLMLAEEVAGPTYRARMRQRGATPVGEFVRTLLWTLAAPLRPKSARARLSRWRWYSRPYRVSVALLRVRTSS
jgi:SAM-dependent methyltransferase